MLIIFLSSFYLLTFEVNNIDSHMMRKQIKKRHIEKERSKAQKDSHFGTMQLLEEGGKHCTVKQTREGLVNLKLQIIVSSQIKKSTI